MDSLHDLWWLPLAVIALVFLLAWRDRWRSPPAPEDETYGDVPHDPRRPS